MTKITKKFLEGNTSELTLYHYKEPLKKVEDGHGYYGALSGTLDGTKIQCHICGELHRILSLHVYQKHEMSADDYREKFGLAHQTALISEKVREIQKQRTLLWLSDLDPKDWADLQRRRAEGVLLAREKRGTFQPNHRLETKNKRGACPDQLIDRIKQVAVKFGRTPSLAEFMEETGGQRYKHLIFKTFGSWKNALSIAKLQPKERRYGTHSRRYSDEELLEYLTIYAQENHSIPTHTDSRRKLIPNIEIYIRRFGSIENARELAGVYNFVERGTTKPRFNEDWRKTVKEGKHTHVQKR